MTKIPSILEMLKAGAHFGHQRSRWHPKMAQFIFGIRNGVHIIDLEKTAVELTKALEYIKTLASQGKVILFVGTKRQARQAVQKTAEACGMPYVTERWIGGLLTNFDEFKRRLKKFRQIEDMIATGEIEKYTKKEQTVMKKQFEKMKKYLSGLKNLNELPDAMYVTDIRVEKTAVTEANKVNVPMVATCDTNVNPEKVLYPIPCNDDAVHAIEMMTALIGQAITEGKEEYAMRAPLPPATPKAVAMPTDGGARPTLKSAPASTAPKKERRVIKTQEVV
ncbi:MAG: 30S ribosomal protein S2 [Candidatus Magasanikbacteria bacterium]|nr:30S ribosomal protein S2 [Candidatus Magasanikbacteria bacterium]